MRIKPYGKKKNWGGGGMCRGRGCLVPGGGSLVPGCLVPGGLVPGGLVLGGLVLGGYGPGGVCLKLGTPLLTRKPVNLALPQTSFAGNNELCISGFKSQGNSTHRKGGYPVDLTNGLFSKHFKRMKIYMVRVGFSEKCFTVTFNVSSLKFESSPWDDDY